MLPARQIMPPQWMTDYRTVKVMQTLGAYEIPSRAMFVGGCVRNALMDVPVSDIDIATTRHPLQVIERLSAHGIRYIPTGLEHGTVTAIIDDAVFEITTLRKDIETNGRHAVISFTDKWEEDALRRDFTINTLLATPDGMIFDPTGRGLSDLDDRRVVFVGIASERIAEDYLRILRFYRFNARYGIGAPDDEAITACRDNADKIAELSRERVTQEFVKIIQLNTAPAALSLMFENGALPDIGKNYDRAVMERFCDFQTRHDVRDDFARIALLLLDGAAGEGAFAFSNAQKKHMQDVRNALSCLKTASRKKIREAVYRFGNAVTLQGYFIRLALRDDLPDLDLLDIARYWQAPSFPIGGADLMAQGISPGPALGQKLQELEEKWIKSDFSPEFKWQK
ncbi:MAG: CCA tRNA nucleotidyltransferase [Micavibrio aeruginosavorus]|uniref:CCA tRNA nucleotidyltransferase n=1 Tax=Micavibrio aeruginosavorus TaxID=349221 RepID=A0A2W4ZW31_9BACT|nr:MAG: CCA tRNA nucleotidyltransferase [Micavibrio aeruginosavorus]